MHWNSLGLGSRIAFAALAVAASIAGCGGDVSVTSTSAGGNEAKCGNGVVETNEVCDDGNDVSGDGCEADCSFSCDNAKPETGDVKCDDGNLCNGTETCSDMHACLSGMTAPDGAACGTGKICIAGGCVDDICGDGFVNSMEECDDSNMVDGDGCDSCKFTCASDDPTRDCSNLDPCVGTTCDDTKHTCGNPVAPGEVCALNSICENEVCTAIVCGNGKTDVGEACDDGNMTNGDGCEADCTLTTGATCGNGTRDAGEQCDDSNTKNLDGCDSACKFEQVQRATYLHIQFGEEAPFCPTNALGGAFSAAGQGQIQMGLDTGVKDGTVSIMFKMLGINDLTGMSEPSLEVGFLAGAPVKPMGVTYDGTKDLDWWHTIAAQTIDANRNPLEKLAGYISAGTLHAGPGKLTLGINFAGIPATFKMSDARILASIGMASTPLASTGTTPGHLASENLDPALTSFATQGQPDETNAGRLCGNVGATSLDQIPVPAILTMGMQSCDQGYTTANTLLDVFVSGCTVFGAFSVIAATQPDQADSTAPVAGAGAPYTFTTNAGKEVTGCRDKNNQMVDLNTCKTAAAYSSFFKFATGRVIPK
ncbi:MAG TPA: DUF4215 domain-containing protein [Polyangium sp.]|nr:DUF4215 domain-containing protein [Polyangium sp.]